VRNNESSRGKGKEKCNQSFFDFNLFFLKTPAKQSKICNQTLHLQREKRKEKLELQTVRKGMGIVYEDHMKRPNGTGMVWRQL
jgi:hypothetical protein